MVENELLFLCLGNKQCYDNYVNSLESCQTIFEQDLKYLVDFDQESLFDDCIINKAKQTKDPSLCEQLNEDNLGCHLSLAENKEEVLDFCSSLDNSEISGVSPFNQLNVLDNNDFEEISFFSCVLMGWRISNFDLCQDLPEIDKSSDIYKEFKSKNLSLFLDQGKDSCYFSKAVSEKEAVVCDSIKDLSIKNICKSKILNNCRSLEEEEEKKLCNLNLSDEGDCLDQFSEENIHLCLDLLK